MKKSGFKMKGYTYPGQSPMKHAPYAEAHTKAEGKIAHDNTAEAHGKKTEDFYDGSKGKTIQSKGYIRDSATFSYKKDKKNRDTP